MLPHAMMMNYRKTGIRASEISARSLCAGVAMAILCGRIDLESILLMGRWHSDAMM
jgi:hypothetical protein